MKKINVFYAGRGEYWHAGQIADNGTRILFEYTAEAVQKKIEFSPIHLKLRTAAYSGFPKHQHQLPGLISDCLPDGWGMLLMDKIFRKNGVDTHQISPIDRLAFLGDRGIGAFNFKPTEAYDFENKDPSILKIAGEIQKIVNQQASESLSDLARMGGSPHGARPKVLAGYNPLTHKLNHEINSADSEPWLFKFPAQNEHTEVCAIECLYMELAKKSGLNISPFHFFNLGQKLAAFGTQRFDRDLNIKIHTHTLSGLLHTDFRLPSSIDYTTFLKTTRLLTNSESEVLSAYRQCVFNVVFNNRDDHPKNISFILNKKNQWQLSPAYDLTFSYGPGGEHNMDICGEGAEPNRADLLNLSQQALVNPKKAQQIIDEVSEAASEFKITAKNWSIRKVTVDHMATVIEKNLKRVSKVVL